MLSNSRTGLFDFVMFNDMLGLFGCHILVDHKVKHQSFLLLEI